MTDVPELVNEIVSALNHPGDLEEWDWGQFAEGTESDSLTVAYRSVIRHLLDRERPQTADWERVLVAVSAHSSQCAHQQLPSWPVVAPSTS